MYVSTRARTRELVYACAYVLLNVGTYARMYVCTYTRICMPARENKQLFVRLPVCTAVRKYLRTYARKYVCT